MTPLTDDDLAGWSADEIDVPHASESNGNSREESKRTTQAEA